MKRLDFITELLQTIVPIQNFIRYKAISYSINFLSRVLPHIWNDTKGLLVPANRLEVLRNFVYIKRLSATVTAIHQEINTNENSVYTVVQRKAFRLKWCDSFNSNHSPEALLIHTDEAEAFVSYGAIYIFIFESRQCQKVKCGIGAIAYID